MMKRYFRDDEHPWVRGVEFEDLSGPQLVERVNRRMSSKPASGHPTAWIIDLDSTLFAVGGRIRGILAEFLRNHEQPPQAWHLLLGRLNPHLHRYDIERSFADAFAEWDSTSASDRARELWQAFEPFWRSRFFSSHHIDKDEAYPGAVDWVQGISRQGHEIVYLTGRERLAAIDGTFRALRASGFPVNESTHLFMKPGSDETDVVFKERALRTLRDRFEVMAFIDNEPENLVAAARELPRAEIVLFHTIMSARVPKGDFKALLGDRKPLRLVSFE